MYFSITIHGNDAVTVACMHLSIWSPLLVLVVYILVQYSQAMNTQSHAVYFDAALISYFGGLCQ